MLEERFPRGLGSLAEISRFVAGYLDQRGFDPEQGYSVDLIIEELFTNMVRHGKGGGSDVEIRLDGEGDNLVITLRDFDVEEFDPTAAPAADTTGSLEERRPGGLGIHLVRKLSDSIRYEYVDRCAVITVTKRMGP